MRINTEAERLALLARASKLQEKHAIEAQEEMLRKRKETLDLDAEIEAATVKINYLKEAESNMCNPMHLLPPTKRLDYSLHLHDSTAPASGGLRGRAGGATAPLLASLVEKAR